MQVARLQSPIYQPAPPRWAAPRRGSSLRRACLQAPVPKRWERKGSCILFIFCFLLSMMGVGIPDRASKWISYTAQDIYTFRDMFVTIIWLRSEFLRIWTVKIALSLTPLFHAENDTKYTIFCAFLCGEQEFWGEIQISRVQIPRNFTVKPNYIYMHALKHKQTYPLQLKTTTLHPDLES